MKGAREYVDLVQGDWEQYGKLLMITGHHARGKTLEIYVLPSEDEHKGKYGQPYPLPENSVEVYGVVSGQRGWTEVYDWIHQGPWVVDFKLLIEERRKEKEDRLAVREELERLKEEVRFSEEKEILSNY